MNIGSSEETRSRAKLIRAAELLVTGWAYVGGMLLIAVVLINVISVVGGIVLRPFPGDFELTEIGVAVAAFAFLPYCQFSGANVTADIFTSKASQRVIDLLATLASLVATLFAGLLLWRMYEGMLSQREYGYTTAILQVPVWLVYVPVLCSLALLFAASVVSIFCRPEISEGIPAA